jgi:hypothetical protein
MRDFNMVIVRVLEWAELAPFFIIPGYSTPQS